MYAHRDRISGHSQRSGHLRILSGTRVSFEEKLQLVKYPPLASRVELLPQPRHCLLQQRGGPAPLVFVFRREIGGRLLRKEIFGGLLIQSNQDLPASPFGSVGPVALIAEVMVEHRQKERAKLALLAVGHAYPVLFQQAGKEPLGEVLSIMRRMALASHIGVEGIPVSAAQLFKGCFGLRRGG